MVEALGDFPERLASCRGIRQSTEEVRYRGSLSATTYIRNCVFANVRLSITEGAIDN